LEFARPLALARSELQVHHAGGWPTATFGGAPDVIDEDLQTAPRTPTLRSQVEDRLRAAILSGRFKPGQRLVERELCHMISVSRPSIREAIRQLEAEGLVVSQPYRGPSVSTITPAEARQLYTVRSLLEGHAGEQFALDGSEAALAALGQAVTRLEAVIAAGGEPALLIEAKSAFYAILMEGAGNVFVRQTLAVLHNRVTLLRLTSMSQPGRLAHAMAEIRAIHAAVIARDPAAAKAACERHVAEAAAVALAALEAAEP
jgi:DNA-binding GntR family transcriptional regulator